MPQRVEQVFSAQTTTGASPAVTVAGAQPITLYVKASSVSTGFTIDLEISPDGSEWFQATTRTVSANGNTSDTATDAAKFARANITSLTDGSADAWIVTSTERSWGSL